MSTNLLLGPSLEVQQLMEHLSSHFVMRKVGRLEQLNVQHRIDQDDREDIARIFSRKQIPKLCRDVIALVRLEDPNSSATQSV